MQPTVTIAAAVAKMRSLARHDVGSRRRVLACLRGTPPARAFVRAGDLGAEVRDVVEPGRG